MAIVDLRSTGLAVMLMGVFWMCMPTAHALKLSMQSNEKLAKVVGAFESMVDCLPVVRTYDMAQVWV